MDQYTKDLAEQFKRNRQFRMDRAVDAIKRSRANTNFYARILLIQAITMCCFVIIISLSLLFIDKRSVKEAEVQKTQSTQELQKSSNTFSLGIVGCLDW